MLDLLQQKFQFYRMKKTNSLLVLFGIGINFFNSCHAMGLRSFVALPLDKQGTVIRLFFEHALEADYDQLTTNIAYGISKNQTLFLSESFRFSGASAQRVGDVSMLYRHIIWQNDYRTGTNRLGLLGGIIIPTASEREMAIQTGFVFTHFSNRFEIDVDGLYQTGINSRPDSGRFDVSWQYRLFPAEYPDWGMSSELYAVIEYNGRWKEENSLTHQLTTGLQWVHQSWVIEGGIAKEINNKNDWHFILSTRFHF